MSKVCSACKKRKDYDYFHKCKKMKDGFKSACKLCRKQKAQLLYIKNKKAIDERNQLYYQSNKDKMKITRKRYYEENKEHLLMKSKEWSKNNRDKKNSHRAKRRSKKLKATPHWSEQEKINLLYEKAKWLGELTGITYHVDHIIPLVSPDVCGLHVWSNLQILESSINFSKGNRHDQYK